MVPGVFSTGLLANNLAAGHFANNGKDVLKSSEG